MIVIDIDPELTADGTAHTKAFSLSEYRDAGTLFTAAKNWLKREEDAIAQAAARAVDERK